MTDAKSYREELVAEVQRLTLHAKLLHSAQQWNDGTREEALETLARFDLEQLPTADATPLVVSVMRAELARCLMHLRHAGRIAKKIGVPMANIEAAARCLRAAIASFPDDLPKPARKLP